MHVYFIRTKDAANLIKIGKSTNVAKRIDGLQTGSPAQLELIGTIECVNVQQAGSLEKLLHRVFACYRTRGEWFTSGAPLRELVAAVRCGMHVSQALTDAMAHPSYKKKVIEAKRREKYVSSQGFRPLSL